MPIFIGDPKSSATHVWRRASKFAVMWTDEDNPKKLHAIAQKIGLRREWYHGDGVPPHYQVIAQKRVLAIQNGALAQRD